MLEIKKLTIKNFLSHLNTSINFEDLSGLVLIDGKNYDGRFSSNGSGKSTILEGIVYSLTGNTLRGLSVNDVVNRISKKDTCASLEFINNGEHYRVERYRKDTLEGDNLKLWDIGENESADISKRLNKDTQSDIDNKLGIPYRVLTSTMVLGEGLSSRFTQLSDGDKKSLIESTLSLSYDMNDLRAKANSKLNEIKMNISELNGSISAMNSTIESFNPEDDISSYEESIENNLKYKIDIESSIKEYNSLLQIIQNKISVIEKAKSEYDNLLSKKESYKSNIEDLVVKLNELNVKEIPSCPLCGQKLNSNDSMNSVKSKYTQDIQSYQLEIDNIISQLNNFPVYDIMKNKLDELKSDYTEISSKLNDLNRNYVYVCSEIKSSEAIISKNKELNKNIDSYREKLEYSKVELDKSSIDLKDYTYLYDLFSPKGLITYILEEAVSYINDRMKIYSEMLIDKSYSIKFNKGKITLVDSTGASYQSLSNGEKRRLDICIQFSLHDYVHNYCGIKVDTLFIDEILDTLDIVGVENIFDVLELKMNYCDIKRTLVITHNDNLKSHFDRIITVEKDKDGYSKII